MKLVRGSARYRIDFHHHLPFLQSVGLQLGLMRALVSLKRNLFFLHITI